MTRFEAFRHVVLLPALGKVWPALSSQIIIVMLGSAVCSQIATEELSFAANFIQSRNFRAFGNLCPDHPGVPVHGADDSPIAQLDRPTVCREEQPMSDFSFWDIVRNLLTGLQWTLLLSLVAFVGGGLIGLLVMTLRISRKAFPRNMARTYIELFQGTPLLMQLFLVFFGVALLGVDISPWLAAAIALTLFTSAYLAEIWRGCVDSIAHGQWEASASLALNPLEQLRYVILPQALRIAVAPTVGFSVQVVKGTAVTSIIGFTELTKTGGMLANATFEPFMVYGLVALGYFCSVIPCPSVRATWKETACLCLEFLPCISITAITTYSGHRPDGGRRPGGGDHRPQRLGQVHLAAHPQWPGVDQRRRHRSRWRIPRRRPRRPAQPAAKGRHGLPAIQPVPAPDRGRERDAGAASGAKVPKAKAAVLARQMLDRVGLGEKFDAFPDRLSGGQQQRVAIARALAMSPKVLLCDEITSALDPELVNEVLSVVRQLAQDGMTLIMVTHEMRFAREVGDKLVFMHQGKVHETGDPKVLFANPQTVELANFIGSVEQPG